MERAEWLNQVRQQTEAVYDHLAPAFWVTFGFYENAMHRQFIDKMLNQLVPNSYLLDAGCGAGRYDGLLLESGHRVLGIDQSGNMLGRARQHFPLDSYAELRYEKIGLQEMRFQAEFDAAICIDALEHVFPEDWPGILKRFQRALKPGGLLYVTVEQAEPEELQQSYEKALAQGLPVVFGELADGLDAAYAQTVAQDWQAVPRGQTLAADLAVYHFYPSPDQVREWFKRAALTIEEEGRGSGYTHLLARKNK
jgi:2-polyprenyl-3-methyl-5-hydroxy-6-metoxy-1,4-benzoquinol methylase